MRVLVCGDRNWIDGDHHHLIASTLDGLYTEMSMGYLTVDMDPFVVIEGGASGADAVAKWWATNAPTHAYPKDAENYCPVYHEPYPANWDQHGKAAGPIRNRQMLTEGKPDIVVAFHDDIEHSKGTKDMIDVATRAGVPTYVISRAR